MLASVFLLFIQLAVAPCASAQVVISEMMYQPVGGNTNEFIELHNVGTNTVDLGGWSFSAGITYSFGYPTVLGPGAYLVICVNRAAFALLYPDVTNLAPAVYGGQLSNSGETVTLANANGYPAFSVTYNTSDPWPAAAAGLGSSLVLINPSAPASDPANWAASAQFNGSPGSPDGFFVRDVVINEVLAHTDPPYEDAVELRNLTTNAVSVAGWYLSDDTAARMKYQFPAGSVIPPQGYLVVYQSQLMSAVLPFSLSSKGDDIYLSEADETGKIIRYVDQYQYDASQNGFSFGRHPDGTGDFETLAAPTFGVSDPGSLTAFRSGAGARNTGPKVGPVVINELMYHPAGSNALGRMPVEYVELLNISSSPVPLYNLETPTNTWTLTGGISYDFPTNQTLLPGQFLLVVATNDLAGFRASYGIPANVTVLGPWDKALNNSGDSVRLRAPNNLELPENTVARYVVDEVKYQDQLPWPLAADGLGGSLERTDPLAYGNTAGNWHSTPDVATPGTTNSYYLPTGSIIISEIMASNRSTLRDEDGDFSDWIELCNTTGHAVSLRGWHLTDQSDAPTLWTFPDVSIPANGQLVVFASQKDRANPLSQLHTNFGLDAAGEYLALFRDDLALECAFDPAYPPQSADVSYGLEAVGARTETPIRFGTAGRYLVPTNAAQLASDWTSRTFSDSAWKPAGNGIGYDIEATYRTLFQTDLYSEMYNKQGSAFVRYPFVLDSSASVEQLLLRLKFEDGAAVWLNGTLVATNNAPASLAWNSVGSANRNDSLALAFLDLNLNAFTHLLADGTNVLAMQLINTTLNSSDLLLMSELRLTWAAPTGAVSQVSGYLAPATPGSANGTVFTGVVPPPILSNPGCVFTGTLSVTVTCANAQAALRYTLDGSEPTTNSPLYSVPLTFTAETELITRAFVPGLAPSPVTGAVYRRTFLGINEILADNVASTPEINDFTDFGDWIELFNGGSAAIDLGGYYLSDNLESPFRWRIPAGATIPAGGHLLFWADGYDSKPGLTLSRDFWPYYSFVTRAYHTNFKLSADGEAVGLFTPSGSRVDAASFGAQQGDLSLGRYPDGGATWGYFGEPTAGTTNRLPQLAQNLHRAPAVTVSPAEPLFVTGPVQVTMSAGPGAAAIRYTLDSSQPNSASLLYTQAFTVTSNTVVRARAFAAGLHPSQVTTRTFLVNQRNPDLPVVSFVIDPRLLYDNVYGIFKNNLKEREVPGSIQFCITPSNTAFKIDAGFRMFSLNTFLGPQKPLTVYLDGKYGTSEIGCQLFPEKPIGLFDRFVLRNGCDDWASAYFRDGLTTKILEGRIVNALQGYRPTASFLNGTYYGLFNIREKLDEMYVVKNFGTPLENIDFYEMNGGGYGAEPLLDCGTDAGWLAITAFVSTHDLSNPSNYAYVCSQVNIEDLMDFVIASSCTSHTAWFWNRKWWRDRGPDGRWRWGFFDLDRVFVGGTENTDILADMATNMELFRELLANQEFRAYFAQRFAAHVNSTFNPDRVIPIIDREAARIRGEMAYHVGLYGTQGGIPSLAAWEAQVDVIRNFVRERPAIVLQQLATLLGASGTAQVNVQTPSGGGQVLANYVPLSNGGANTLMAGVPVRFTALPAIGQTFAYWIVSTNQTVNKIPSGSVWRYFDLGTEPGAANGLTWRSTSYADANWASGPAILGFVGSATTNPVATVTRRYVNNVTQVTTTYFRRAFTLDTTAGLEGLSLGILLDDGAVVYLNGTELLRENMPSGTPTYGTLATATLGSPEQNTTYARYVSAAPLLRTGTNVVAVELHQANATSSDLYFDLQASVVGAFGTSQTNFSPVLEITPGSAAGLTVQAVFTPTGESLLPSVVTGTLALTAAGSPWLATGDIYVPSNTSLIAGPGVTILMPDAASIYVQGELRLAGTSGAPVRIGPNTNASARALIYVNPALADATDLEPRWGGIAFNHADHAGILSNVVVRGASLADHDAVNMKAAVSSLGSDLYLNGLDIADVRIPIFVQEGNSTVLENSRLFIRVIGDAINIKRARYARVENCDMSSASTTVDTDAIDYDGINGGIIRGNHLHDFMGDNNDAIDIGEGTRDLIVEGNRIERCFDKAVSIGQSSTATVRHNLISDVDMGLGIKDSGSYGLIEKNTFRDVSHAVAVYQKNLGAGGGAADVRNCVVSHASLAPFTCDALSSLNVSYTLADTEPVPGSGNLFAEPQFLRPGAGNFSLQTGSAAVDSGDPASPLDPDGSRADMGAVAFDWRQGHLVISEIHYHPAVAGQAEYVELTNPGGAPLDLTGYSFSKGFTYTFPAGTVLHPGTYLAIASGSGIPGARVWASGTLDNAGEALELIDAVSNEIDRVAYEPLAPWPTEPDGFGPSLSLIHPRWDNALPASWRASAAPGGTPGGAELAAHDTPVWWLAQWGATGSFDAAATADWDLDGMANWAEYEAGTQPTNAASVFVVALTTAAGKPTASCQTRPAGTEYGGRQRYYTFELRTNLLSGAWTGIPGYTDILGTGQTILYQDPPPGTGFIRARTELR